MTKGKILVTGATGNQGGAVLRSLLKAGWQVRALTRNPEKPAAKELAGKGAEVVGGDFDDRASLDRALDGVYGVYSVQNFLQVGTQKEAEQGKVLADAAKAAGVKHLVYSSVGGADRHTGIGHFESKWAIEQHIRALDLPATILRPVFFMEVLLASGPIGFIFWSALAGALPSPKKIQLIGVDDIGEFAAIAFNNPERYIGTAWEIAGDELSLAEIADLYAQYVGKRPRYIPLPSWVLRRINEDLGAMFAWFKEKGFQADIPTLRQINPEVKSFEQWLDSKKASGYSDRNSFK